MRNGQDVKKCLNYLPQITGDLHFSWLNIRYKTLVNRFLFKISRYSICRWQTPPTKKANCVYILTLTTCWEMFAYVSDYTIYNGCKLANLVATTSSVHSVHSFSNTNLCRRNALDLGSGTPSLAFHDPFLTSTRAQCIQRTSSVKRCVVFRETTVI